MNEMDTGSDLLQRMHLNLKEEIVTACSDGNMVFFHLNASSGVMTFLKRISADFTEPEAPSLVCQLPLSLLFYLINNNLSFLRMMQSSMRTHLSHSVEAMMEF